MSNYFLGAIPSFDNRRVITEKISNCEAKRSPLIRIHWTHIDDLHVTLGYIGPVEQKDLRTISLCFSEIAKSPPLMINTEEVKVYGTALVLRLEPQHQLAKLHKTMQDKLKESTEGKYRFHDKRRFEAHLTIARIRNWDTLNHAHKRQFINLISAQFKETAFLIRQAALMRRHRDKPQPVYEMVKQYNLNG